jgi:hypothetical protein
MWFVAKTWLILGAKDRKLLHARTRLYGLTEPLKKNQHEADSEWVR